MMHCNDTSNYSNCPEFKDRDPIEWLGEAPPCNAKWGKVSDHKWEDIIAMVKSGHTVSLVIGKFDAISIPSSKELSIQEMEVCDDFDKLFNEKIGKEFVGIITLINDSDEPINTSEHLDSNC